MFWKAKKGQVGLVVNERTYHDAFLIKTCESKAMEMLCFYHTQVLVFESQSIPLLQSREFLTMLICGPASGGYVYYLICVMWRCHVCLPM